MSNADFFMANVRSSPQQRLRLHREGELVIAAGADLLRESGSTVHKLPAPGVQFKISSRHHLHP